MYDLLIEYVREIREEAPRLGCEKLFEMGKSYFGERFHLGRDAFYNLLRDHSLMLRLKKRKHRTTYADQDAPFYPNLIKGITVDRANQVWVCDITYIWTLAGFCFLFLVTDLYSHKIMGWKLSNSLKYKNAEDALRKAIEHAGCSLEGLIHHSDRGFQYTYSNYMELLREYRIKASRTEHGNPLENAVAERVNGILKQEWLSLHTFENEEGIRDVLEHAIRFYNERRPHASNDMLTPAQAYDKVGILKRRWENHYPATPSPQAYAL